MSGQPLFGRLFPLVMALFMLSLGIIVIPLVEGANRSLRLESRATLRKEGEMLREMAIDPLVDRHPQSLRGLCERIASDQTIGVAIIDAERTPLCSSGALEVDAKDIASALAGAPLWREGEVLTVALPIVTEGRIIGAVAISRMAPGAAVGGIFFWIGILILAAGSAAFVTWRTRGVVAAGLDRLSQGAARFAMGRFDQHVDGGEVIEFANAAESLNRMAGALSNRLSDADEADRGAAAILASMHEGVLAVGPDGAIIRINPALRRILSIKTEVASGTPLADILPNSDLLRYLTDALVTPSSLEREVSYEHGALPRNLQLVVTPLMLEREVFGGVVATISDVTDLRRLENLRRDFAANVSHELRTPITSIRGYVETLLDDDLSDPEQTHRFLDVVRKHVDRLASIVEDLLTLARLDRTREGEETPLTLQPVAPILRQAVEDLAHKANQRKITIQVECPEEAQASLNRPLMERAVANLLDNAIGHSDEGGEVELSATLTGKTLYVSVRDHGSGIEKGSLDRIFERFYRVDAARSRARGGTGLGLSIVKNVALAHRGRVTVQSTVGEGSSFTLVLPAEGTER